MDRPEITFDEYRRIDALNPSAIVYGRMSMKHVKHAMNDRSEPTDAMRLGTLTHLLCFEADRVEREVAVWKGGRRDGKAWDEFVSENAGKLIVTERQVTDAVAVAGAVTQNAVVRPYIAEGVAEYTVQVKEQGVACKGRIDWISTAAGREAIVDLKTASNITPYKFGLSAGALGYHIKMACYHRWFEMQTGKHIPRVLLIAVESKAPYDVAVYEVTPSQLEDSWKQAEAIIKRYAECLAKNEWPGMADDIEPLQLSPYVLSGEQDVIFDEDV